MSSDFSGLGILFTGFAVFFGDAESVVGFTFYGPCARFCMAGFGLFEFGLELFERELFRLLLPSLLFINSKI
jgi:hypothetical protein